MRISSTSFGSFSTLVRWRSLVPSMTGEFDPPIPGFPARILDFRSWSAPQPTPNPLARVFLVVLRTPSRPPRGRLSPTRIGPSYLFTASLRPLPGEKRGRIAALIFIGAPVCGCRPSRAACFVTLN